MTIVYWCRYPTTPGEPVYEKSFDNDDEGLRFANEKRMEYCYTCGQVWTKKFVEVPS